MTEDDVLNEKFKKKQEAAVKLGLDLEPYDAYLGEDFVPSYVETLMAVQRQFTRKLNKIAKNMIAVQYLDFNALEDQELNRIMEEEDGDD
jgi:hypothetical protein